MLWFVRDESLLFRLSVLERQGALNVVGTKLEFHDLASIDGDIRCLAAHSHAQGVCVLSIAIRIESHVLRKLSGVSSNVQGEGDRSYVIDREDSGRLSAGLFLAFAEETVEAGEIM